MYYSVIGALASLILVIENQDVFLNRNRAFDKPAWKVYKDFLIAVLVYYITDIAWGILESRKLSLLLFVDTSVYFIAMAAGVLFWTKYTVTYLEEKNVIGRILLLGGRVTAALITLTTIVNIFTPVLFTVDANCVYQPLNLRYVVLTAQILLLLLISVYAFVGFLRHRSENKMRYRTLALFGIIMAFFLCAQLWFPLLPLYSIAYMLGTSLLRAFVIGDEKEAYRHGLEEAKKITELKQSITSLLDNMPALSYSKDVETGAYLACNQAFAAFAQKRSPEKVVGLTDYDLFDELTAVHFVESDRTAMAMDKPYILFEDAADAVGNPRRFQTTKLKFYDANGKLCLLGMSVDVTEMETIRKESEQTKAAYQAALSTNATYENIVKALSADYFDLYYVDLKNDTYIEYGSIIEDGYQSRENRGTDFFRMCKKDIRRFIHKDDRDRVVAAMNKKTMIAEIRKNGMFAIQYRLLVRDVPTYVSMKATSLRGDENHIIIGVTNVDAQVRDHLAAQQASEDRKAYTRLSVLTDNLLVLYMVDPDSGHYTEYSATSFIDELGIEKQGDDFFRTSRENCRRTVYPDDLDMVLSWFTKDTMMGAIRKNGKFVRDYRLMIADKPAFIRLKAARVEEDGKTMLIVGLLNIDAEAQHEQAHATNLSVARKKATQDALTGVRNKYAFVEAEQQLNAQILGKKTVSFAVVVCDINDLKVVNDTQGHKAGDQYIQSACRIICDVFSHSQVYRIGGDEFAVICQGRDYDHIEKLMEKMEASNTKGNVRIACGMAKFEDDKDVETVFERADQRMYVHKAQLKK